MTGETRHHTHIHAITHTYTPSETYRDIERRRERETKRQRETSGKQIYGSRDREERELQKTTGSAKSSVNMNTLV